MYSLIYFKRPFVLAQNTVYDCAGKPLFYMHKPYSQSQLQMQEIVDCLNSDDECYNTDEDYDLTLNNNNIYNNGKIFITTLFCNDLLNKFDEEKTQKIKDEFVWWIIKQLTNKNYV